MSRLPSLGPRGEGWVALQAILLGTVLLAGLWSERAWSGLLATATAAVGISLIAAGGLLIGRGLLDLGSNLTALPHPRDGTQLVEHGAYGLVRHPLYGGLTLVALGWGALAASPSTIVLALCLGVFFDLKSRREEAWLRSRFPGYEAYAGRTHRLIPWLY